MPLQDYPKQIGQSPWDRYMARVKARKVADRSMRAKASLQSVRSDTTPPSAAPNMPQQFAEDRTGYVANPEMVQSTAAAPAASAPAASPAPLRTLTPEEDSAAILADMARNPNVYASNPLLRKYAINAGAAPPALSNVSSAPPAIMEDTAPMDLSNDVRAHELMPDELEKVRAAPSAKVDPAPSQDSSLTTVSSKPTAMPSVNAQIGVSEPPKTSTEGAPAVSASQSTPSTPSTPSVPSAKPKRSKAEGFDAWNKQYGHPSTSLSSVSSAEPKKEESY